MTHEEAVEALIDIQSGDDDDIEIQHKRADKVLCDFLVSLGYQDVVDEYECIGRWSA